MIPYWRVYAWPMGKVVLCWAQGVTKEQADKDAHDRLKLPEDRNLDLVAC
jgi:hypothetical protein